jgi:hypothetical protein
MVSRFSGLIQHTFALRNPTSNRPFHTGNIKEIVGERFALPSTGGAEFQVRGLADHGREAAHLCSPLVKHGLTTLDPGERADFLRWNHDEHEYARLLPPAFSWAAQSDGEKVAEERKHWEKFIFAKEERNGQPSLNDFLVKEWDSSEPEARSVSEMLCELLAARRSMLFGLSLANRFVNVVLPHALLTPASSAAGTDPRRPAAPWILQPLVSLIRVGRNGSKFRRTYSLTLFLVPVVSSCCEARQMSTREIELMVNAGWGLASSPSDPPRFDVSGPLPGYVSRLTPSVKEILDPAASANDASEDKTENPRWEGRGLREATEAITFAVALRMAQGPTGSVPRQLGKEIGNEVVTSLGNSRVSSVVVVDDKFTSKQKQPDDSWLNEALPGSLGPLLDSLSGEVCVPLSGQSRKYRLDRPYIDHDDYAIGVLPSNRCLVVTSAHDAQCGRARSGLMQAGWMAYTVIGAASAIGAIRAINRDLETVERSSPGEIGKLEGEVTVDLHEIYDLDITWEAYRLRYRRLREQLGITSDYEALHSKLNALYRETSARFEAKTQQRLLLLTIVIAVASVFVLGATILK